MKLVVKCACGKDVVISKSEAARIMVAGNKTKLNAEQRSLRARKAVNARWKKLDIKSKV